MDKVLLVGINTYPTSPLRGCVNDVIRMSEVLTKLYNVKEEDIRMLVDSRATKGAIIERLNWLVEGVKSGDRIYFHFSGHGSQVADRNDCAEVDQLAEIICPYDFDWDPNCYITDHEFYNIFKNITEGVRFNWASDSCHSGGLASIDREISSSPTMIRSRYIEPPEDIAWKIKIAKSKGILTARESKKLNVGFISGCRSNQTSADTVINGKPCGALTYYFSQSLSKISRESLKAVVEETSKTLNRDGYEQVPEAEGSLIGFPFWETDVAVVPVTGSLPITAVKPSKRKWYFPWTWWAK